MEEKDETQQQPKLDLPKYEAPKGDYEEWSKAFDQIRMQQAQRLDPQRQAEEDARIQRGRNFWTGANLFANVVANAINAYGTANGAPNMKWDNEAQKSMFDRWQEADRQLKADRKAAQDRYDELALQDAKWKAALGQQQHADEVSAYDKNYQNAVATATAEFNAAREDERERRRNEHDDQVRQQQQQFQAGEAAKQRNFTASQNRESRQHQEQMLETRTQMSKGYNKGTKTIRIGNTDFKAETEAEADSNIAQVYGMVLAAYNKNQDALHQQPFDGKPETEYSFINAHINQLYASDPDFKAQYDAFVTDHARSVATNHTSGGQQQQPQTPPSGHVR